MFTKENALVEMLYLETYYVDSELTFYI